ncbi:MAG: penicillin-binding protein activator [Alphaproteobacteria bacterium]
MMFTTYTKTNSIYFNLFVGLTNFCNVTNMRNISFFIILLFVLIGCQEQGTGPVVKTIYIEDSDTLPPSATIDPKTEINKKNQSEEASTAPVMQIDNEIDNAIDNVIERIEQEPADEDVLPDTKAMPEGQLVLAPTAPTLEDKFGAVPPVDNTLKTQSPDENNDQQAKLKKAALEAAFDMLARRAKPIQIDPQTRIEDMDEADEAAKKSKFKIGLLVPLTGSFSYLGNTISGGSELAFFKMRNPNIELLYFDTAGGEQAVNAANEAISNNVDVVIGPLFSDSVSAVKPLLKASNIPVLSFSKNIYVAEPGVWVLGYLPEHQISQLVDFAVARGKQNFGILSSNSQLGKKITKAAINQLADYGLSARTIFELDNISQMEQEELLSQIKTFAKYVDTSKDPLTLPPPAYDTVIIAGDTDFILQVAPILSYYDLGPDRALFMGIDKWNQQKILNEPSLQNSILTLPKRPAEEKFNNVWQSEFTIESNDLAKISFDASALVIATAVANAPIPLAEDLATQPGFIGFSGQFKLSKSGLTERVFEIMEISDNLLAQPSIQ